MPSNRIAGLTLVTALALTSTIATTASAQAQCETGTIASYIAMSSCQFGGLVYSQFSAIGYHFTNAQFADISEAFSAWTVTPTFTTARGRSFSGFLFQGSDASIARLNENNSMHNEYMLSFHADATWGTAITGFYAPMLNPSALGIPSSTNAFAEFIGGVMSGSRTGWTDQYLNDPGQGGAYYCDMLAATDCYSRPGGPDEIVAVPYETSLDESADMLVGLDRQRQSSAEGAYARMDGFYLMNEVTVTATPEPGSALLFASGGAILFVAYRVRRRYTTQP